MKRLKLLVGAVALFAIVVANVWNAATTLTGSELRVANVEAMANPEGQNDVDGKKKVPDVYPCYVTRMVTFDSYGRYQLPDGSCIYGPAGNTEIRTFTYKEIDCFRGDGKCVRICCRW